MKTYLFNLSAFLGEAPEMTQMKHTQGAPAWKEISNLEKSKEHEPEELGNNSYKKPIHTITSVNRSDPRADDISPSGWNSLENHIDHIPGKPDKDAKTMQLDPQRELTLEQLEEELNALELELEGLITPDVGMKTIGRGFYGGVALTPSNGYETNFDPAPPAAEECPINDPRYDRNFSPDLPGPEEGGEHQSAFPTLVAKKKFVPSESLTQRIREDAARNRAMRFSKFRE